jgi:hypothetical protein
MFMQEDSEVELGQNPLEKSILALKTNRTVQIISVLVGLLLISIPAYSMYSKSQIPEDEYQREIEYLIDYDYGSITWNSNSNLELNDEQVFSLLLTNDDFPEEAKEMNIVSVSAYIEVLDFNEDNEETNGLGCAVDSGEDAPDSASLIFSSPNYQTELLETQSMTGDYIFLLEEPEFMTFPFITGYTINEIEEMYESDDEDIIGEYNFEIRGMVEAGDSTLECDREDPSVTISYSIELEWLDINVIEWNGDSMWF